MWYIGRGGVRILRVKSSEQKEVNILVQISYRYENIINQIHFTVLICLNKNPVHAMHPFAEGLWLLFFKRRVRRESKANSGHMIQSWKHFVAGSGSWKCHYRFVGMHQGRIKCLCLPRAADESIRAKCEDMFAILKDNAREQEIKIGPSDSAKVKRGIWAHKAMWISLFF